MNIAFRVDGGKKLGVGHLKRCLTLANFLSKKGVNCIFIISNTYVKEIIESHGYKVFRIKNNQEGNQIQKILSVQDCCKLIIDSKRKTIEKIFPYLKSHIKIILIDNNIFSKRVNLVILPTVKGSVKTYPKNCLVGIDYVITSLNFKPKICKRDSTILISMGGSDKHDITSKIVSAFAKSNYNFKILIILGKFYEYEDKVKKIISKDKRFKLIKNVSNLSLFMTKCSLGIITFGITVFEAALCRLPVLVIAHSEENARSAKKVEKLNWSKYVGKYDKINYSKVVNMIISTLKNRALLKKMSLAGQSVDGCGNMRVAEAIMNV